MEVARHLHREVRIAGYRLQIAEPQQPWSSQRQRVNPRVLIPIARRQYQILTRSVKFVSRAADDSGMPGHRVHAKGNGTVTGTRGREAITGRE